MPYIKKESRPAIDKLVVPLIEHLRKLPLEEQDGSLNYAITRILRGAYPRRYFNFNRALGVLHAVSLLHAHGGFFRLYWLSDPRSIHSHQIDA